MRYLREITKACQFLGGCLDIGAQKTVARELQARAYSATVGRKFSLLPSHYAFRFGDGLHASLGWLMIRIPTPDGIFIETRVEVGKVDVPLLLGIDLLDRERLVADNVENVLHSRRAGWKMPVIRRGATDGRGGHMYLLWDCSQLCFTKGELKKLHLHFFHPSSRKLYNLLKRAEPEHCTAETLSLLGNISKSFESCPVYSPGPHRFRVSMPKNGVVFNQELALDLMFIDNRAILHVVVIQTGFGSAVILQGRTTRDVWISFIRCWAAIYPGYPDKMRVDPEGIFRSKAWAQLAATQGILEVQLSGVEGHNALGLGERYHAPLRRIFLKICH